MAAFGFSARPDIASEVTLAAIMVSACLIFEGCLPNGHKEINSPASAPTAARESENAANLNAANLVESGLGGVEFSLERR